MRDVCEWLRSYLEKGPVDVGEIRKAAKMEGISRGDLREAKRLLGVVTTNNWNAGRKADTWYWSLRED